MFSLFFVDDDYLWKTSLKFKNIIVTRKYILTDFLMCLHLNRSHSTKYVQITLKSRFETKKPKNQRILDCMCISFHLWTQSFVISSLQHNSFFFGWFHFSYIYMCVCVCVCVCVCGRACARVTYFLLTVTNFNGFCF
jgi:hypothetical protein